MSMPRIDRVLGSRLEAEFSEEIWHAFANWRSLLHAVDAAGRGVVSSLARIN